MLKLECPDGFIEDAVPVYDLIILDELESILKQFNSVETFKDRSIITFGFLDLIIKSSIDNKGRIISMDGDLGSRAMHFLNKYGNAINIINTVKFNTFNLSITSKISYVESQIFEALDQKKNIVIPSMSAGFANQIFSEITEKYPDLKVVLYTSSSGGKEKTKMKNVDELWSDVNVLIYSPTISAGVSFDKYHFHKIFGVICNSSCSARDYHQMLRRVRKTRRS